MTFKLTKMFYISHNKRQKVCLCPVWIWLITAYLLCAREFRQNNALMLQFWCLPMHSPFRFVHLTHQNLSARALFCLNSLAKVNMQLLIYKWCETNRQPDIYQGIINLVPTQECTSTSMYTSQVQIRSTPLSQWNFMMNTTLYIYKEKITICKQKKKKILFQNGGQIRDF